MTNDTPTTPPADRRRQLSDPKVVERLFTDLARESVGCRVATAKGIITEQDAITIEDKEIQHRVWPFVGRDNNYAIVPEWHTPGKIDSYLATHLQLEPRGLENVIRAALTKFVSEVQSAVNIAENADISDLQAKEKSRELVARYRDLFMGGVPKPAVQPVEVPAAVGEPIPAPTPVSTPSNLRSKTSTQKYLGDPDTLDAIFTTLAIDSLRIEKAVAGEQIWTSDGVVIQDKEIDAAANIFLGRNPKYAIDPNWNSAGGLDAFLARELGLAEQGDENIIKAALRRLTSNVRDAVNAANGINLPEHEWKPLVKNTVGIYRNLFLGLHVELPSAAAQVPEVSTSATPDWLAEELAQATAASRELTPGWSESKAVVEKVAPADVPKRRGRGVTWKVAVGLVVVVGVAAVFIVPRSQKPKEVAVVAPPVVVKEEPKAKIFMIRGGKLVTADGKEVLPQSEGGAGNGESTLEFWYDMNIATGVAQFLVAKNRDTTFKTHYEGPSAWDLWLTDENGKERLITKGAFRARFSPDGSMIAYTTKDCVLHVEDLEGKELAQTERAYEPNWSADGSLLLFQHVPKDLAAYPPPATQLAKFNWKANEKEIILDGRYDDITPHFHPNGEWILFVSGTRTGGRAFWKVPAYGGQPMQLTNVRMAETETQFVPTPYQTTLWSGDGKWFLFDFKIGTAEETWGLEFDAKGKFQRAVKLSDGLTPQWTGPSTFICQKRVGNGFEMVQQSLPGS